MSLYFPGSRPYGAMSLPPDLYSDRPMLSTALLCLSSLSASTVQDESPWLDLTFAEARELAATKDKPLFVYFYAPYDKTCDHLDAVVWSNGGVVDHLRGKTIPIRLDTSRSREVCNQNDVTINATMVWFEPDGSEMDRIVHDGKKNSTYFLEISHLFLDGLSDLQQLAKEVETNPNDGLKRVWYARTLNGRGRTRDALDQYLWAFDNCSAPEFDEYRRGDLLFSTRHLFETTNSTSELESRADQGMLTVKRGPEAIRKMLGGHPSEVEVNEALARTAADAASIRWALEDVPTNIELFEALEGLPHAQVAREAILPWTAESLSFAKRYAEVVDSIADMSAHFDRMHVQYEQRLERLKLELPKKRHWQARARAMDGIGKRFGAIFVSLLGVGRIEEAAAQADRMLALSDSSDAWVVVLQRAGQVENTEFVQKYAAKGMAKFEKGTRDYNRIRRMLRLFGGTE